MSIFYKHLSTFYCKYLVVLVLLLVAVQDFAQNFNYAPNSIHFCRLQQKYSTTLAGGIGQGNNFNSREWQAAFSPVEHGAIMINYFDAHKKSVVQQKEDGASSRFVEIGIGAYETTAIGTASIFAGFGQGSLFNNYLLNHTSSFSFQRWFIQPSILRHSKNFEWGIALRFNRLIYSSGEIDYSISDYDLRAIRAIESKSPFFIPELGLHAGLNFSSFNAAINITNVFYAVNTYNFERANTSLLLTFDVSSLYKKNKKSLDN